jgi:hypothetical protein
MAHLKFDGSSVGATSKPAGYICIKGPREYAAPTELVACLGTDSYKDVAPPELFRVVRGWRSYKDPAPKEQFQIWQGMRGRWL